LLLSGVIRLEGSMSVVVARLPARRLLKPAAKDKTVFQLDLKFITDWFKMSGEIRRTTETKKTLGLKDRQAHIEARPNGVGRANRDFGTRWKH
jgi:hypothetical protein